MNIYITYIYTISFYKLLLPTNIYPFLHSQNPYRLRGQNHRPRDPHRPSATSCARAPGAETPNTGAFHPTFVRRRKCDTTRNEIHVHSMCWLCMCQGKQDDPFFFWEGCWKFIHGDLDKNINEVSQIALLIRRLISSFRIFPMTNLGKFGIHLDLTSLRFWILYAHNHP